MERIFIEGHMWKLYSKSKTIKFQEKLKKIWEIANADPYGYWQRGTDENTNGLIRKIFLWEIWFFYYYAKRCWYYWKLFK